MVAATRLVVVRGGGRGEPRTPAEGGATESRAGDAPLRHLCYRHPRNPHSSAHQGSAEQGDSQTLIIQDKQPTRSKSSEPIRSLVP